MTYQELVNEASQLNNEINNAQKIIIKIEKTINDLTFFIGAERGTDFNNKEYFDHTESSKANSKIIQLIAKHYYCLELTFTIIDQYNHYHSEVLKMINEDESLNKTLPYTPLDFKYMDTDKLSSNLYECIIAGLGSKS